MVTVDDNTQLTFASLIHQHDCKPQFVGLLQRSGLLHHGSRGLFSVRLNGPGVEFAAASGFTNICYDDQSVLLSQCKLVEKVQGLSPILLFNSDSFN